MNRLFSVAAPVLSGAAILFLAGCNRTDSPKAPEGGITLTNGRWAWEISSVGIPIKDKQYWYTKNGSREANGILRQDPPTGSFFTINGKWPAPCKFQVENLGVATCIGQSSDYDFEIRTEMIGTEALASQTFTFVAKKDLAFQFPEGSKTPRLLGVEKVADFKMAAGTRKTWAHRYGGIQNARKPKYAAITIDGPSEDQAVVRLALDQLAFNLRARSFGPFGVSHSRFEGRMFWDSDVYMLPAVAFLDPQSALEIGRERLSQVYETKANATAWFEAGRPIANDKKIGQMKSPEARMFAWEANGEGTEVSTAPTRFAHHGSGSVIWGLHFAKGLGILQDRLTQEMTDGVAKFYEARATIQPDGTWGIENTVSPDEWHVVNDDLYTNMVAAHTIRKATKSTLNPDKVRIPRDAKGIAQFAEDDYAKYQQAAGLLAVWPLQAISNSAEVAQLYDRYKMTTSPAGPAMSHSVHAVVAAQLGRTEEAYTEWLASWKPFTDRPELEFREKRDAPGSYFLTGGAGTINGLIYGFLGVRLTDNKPADGQSVMQLSTGKWVSFRPQLPKAWKSVKIDRFVIDFVAYDLTATGNQVTLVRSADQSGLPELKSDVAREMTSVERIIDPPVSRG